MYFESGLENDDSVSNEIFLNRLRHWRNKELARTDWTQLPDASVNSEIWANYRQLLRDLPASNTNPRAIKLPTPPNA